MVELPDSWKTLLDVLIAAPVAWQSIDRVATALDADIEGLMDLLCEMDVAGWISVWEGGDDGMGVSITLTPLAAERLHVVMVEVGPDELPRWMRPGDPAPASPPRAKHVCHLEIAARLDALPDPILFTDHACERAERVAAQAASLAESEERCELKIAKLPRPTRFLGESLTPWPGPAESSGETCPACLGDPLPDHVYCLVCDRWGLDTLLANLTGRQVPSPRQHAPAPKRIVQAGAPDPEAERRRLDRESNRARARRRAKRKVRRGVQKVASKSCD
jgi:hypothetical protein